LYLSLPEVHLNCMPYLNRFMEFAGLSMCDGKTSMHHQFEKTNSGELQARPTRPRPPTSCTNWWSRKVGFVSRGGSSDGIRHQVGLPLSYMAYTSYGNFVSRPKLWVQLKLLLEDCSTWIVLWMLTSQLAVR